MSEYGVENVAEIVIEEARSIESQLADIAMERAHLQSRLAELDAAEAGLLGVVEQLAEIMPAEAA